MGLFSKIKNIVTGNNKEKYLSGFFKTNNAIGKKLKFLTSANITNKEDFIEKLMITLIEADLGYKTSQEICDIFFTKTKEYMVLTKNDVMEILYETLTNIYNKTQDQPLNIADIGTTVYLIVGVNGVGKTSSIAKMANKFKNEGKSVCVAAADTFRAGAIEQLSKWAEIIGVDIIKGEEKEDPSSVLVKACRYCKENNIDILLCDTAGRLQNKINLMSELDKMNRVLGKEIANAPHNSLIIIDSNTGQNGLSQVKLFSEITTLNGVVLTKTDGTSKGGIILSIKNETNIPVRYITLGESVNDIQDFDLDMYLYSIIGDLDE